MECSKTCSVASPSYLVAAGLWIPLFSPSVPFFPTCTGVAEIRTVHFCWLHKCDPSRERVWRDFISDAAWRGPERWEHFWGDRNNIAVCSFRASQSPHLAVPAPLSPTLVVMFLRCFFIYLTEDVLQALKLEIWGSFTKPVELNSDGLARAFF